MIKEIVEKFVSFPLFKNDGEPLFNLSKEQLKSIRLLNQKIKSGEYSHNINPCLCGNTNPSEDIKISEKDMYGITCDNLLCLKCGLIRNSEIFDQKTLSLFYDNEYKSIFYNLDTSTKDSYFKMQEGRGEVFFRLIKSLGIEKDLQHIFDLGCGAGGVVYPFNKPGRILSGCDYSKDYIAFGNKKGMQIYFGEMSDTQTPDNSQDLIILSHVMEHFTDIKAEMIRIIKKVKPGKYLLVEVPGVFANLPTQVGYPVTYLQKAHTINFFHKSFLSAFFIQLGLEILYGDERCTFVLRKPSEKLKADETKLFFPEQAKTISSYLKFSFFTGSYIPGTKNFRLRQLAGKLKRFIKP